MAAQSKLVGFRLPESLVHRLDNYLDVMKDKNPGLNLTRADVVRMLLFEALEERESN